MRKGQMLLISYLAVSPPKTALSFLSLSGTSFLAVSSDKDLVEASAAEGIDVINPEVESKALEKLQHIV